MNAAGFLRNTHYALRAGFSLTEVVLAIAIVSLAVVGVMTAFPIGMTASRDTRDENVLSLIAEDIFAQIRAQPFDRVQLPEAGGMSSPVNFGDAAAPGGRVYETSINTMPYYTADGRISRSASGAIGYPPGNEDPYRADEGYYGVKITVVNNPYYGIPGGAGTYPIAQLPTLAKVVLDISWPARTPLTPEDRRNHSVFVTYVANLH